MIAMKVIIGYISTADWILESARFKMLLLLGNLSTHKNGDNSVNFMEIELKIVVRQAS